MATFLPPEQTLATIGKEGHCTTATVSRIVRAQQLPSWATLEPLSVYLRKQHKGRGDLRAFPTRDEWYELYEAAMKEAGRPPEEKGEERPDSGSPDGGSPGGGTGSGGPRPGPAREGRGRGIRTAKRTGVATAVAVALSSAELAAGIAALDHMSGSGEVAAYERFPTTILMVTVFSVLVTLVTIWFAVRYQSKHKLEKVRRSEWPKLGVSWRSRLLLAVLSMAKYTTRRQDRERFWEEWRWIFDLDTYDNEGGITFFQQLQFALGLVLAAPRIRMQRTVDRWAQRVLENPQDFTGDDLVRAHNVLIERQHQNNPRRQRG
ncbi:hypothetical protein ABZ464_23775 [Streptomyces sp. NPDC005820]|uniref:hypothetical protein n=1 Tax=Streptomyces sp. NPDC005820 TaxID=3157069 RepID=UPI0033E3B6E7